MPIDESKLGAFLDKQDDEKLVAASLVARDKNPDEVARARKLARDNDWPEKAVTTSPEPFVEKDRSNKLGAADPRTKSWLSNPDNMALVHDDLDNTLLLSKAIQNLIPFGGVERNADQILKAIPRGVARSHFKESASAGLLSGIASTAEAGLDLLDATNPLKVMFGGLADAAKTPDQADAIRELGDPLKLADRAKYQRDVAADAGEQLSYLDKQVGPLPTSQDWMRDPAAAMEQATARLTMQAAQSAPLMALGVATRSPRLGAMALAIPTGGQTYSDMVAQGVPRPIALMAGFGTGAMEYVGEHVGFESLFLKSWRKALWAGPVTEYGQEFVTQIGQEGIENITTGKPLDPVTMLWHGHEAGLVGGFMGAGVTVGRAAINAPLDFKRNLDRRRDLAVATKRGVLAQSAYDSIRLSEITDIAAAAKLGERGPQEIEDFVKHLGGEETNVYIPATEFRTLFQEAGAAQMAQELTGEANALELAGETGDIVIPLAKYVSALTRLPNAKDIAHVARTNPDGWSRKDIEAGDIQTEIDALDRSDRGEKAADRAKTVDSIREGLVGALQATGQYKPADAELMGSLTARMIESFARRSGQDPMELMEKYKLRINGAPAYNGTPNGDITDGITRGTQAQPVPGDTGGAGDVRGSDGLLAESGGADLGSGRTREADGSLAGLPRVVGPAGSHASQFATAHKVAFDIRSETGIGENPPSTYAAVDEARATRIAEAFDAMEHDPLNPEVAASYAAMVQEMSAQYRAILGTGLKVEFITKLDADGKLVDPYAGNPRNMIDDVRNNGHMWVFSTNDGFGSDKTFYSAGNPMLGDTEFTDASGTPMLANDVFRVVHDYFGHVKEGVGFRATGEENAWRAHAAMFSPLARRAMTTETRGQNSWVNYGPHGKQNRKASPADTIYADQKIGLLPEWVSEEGRNEQESGRTLGQPDGGSRRAAGQAVAGASPVQEPWNHRPIQPGAVTVTGIHYSTAAGLQALDGKRYGTNHAGAEKKRLAELKGKDRKALTNRVYFYPDDSSLAKRGESMVGRAGIYTATLSNIHDPNNDRSIADTMDDSLPDAEWGNAFDKAVLAAGFDGYRTSDMVVVFDTAAVPVAPHDRMLGQNEAISADPFYSALLRTVEQDTSAPNKSTVSGWKQWLEGAANRGTIKRAELAWIGVDSWLDDQTGKVTREQLSDFIRANQVQVQDVVLDDAVVESISDELNLWMGDNLDQDTLDDTGPDFTEIAAELMAVSNEEAQAGNTEAAAKYSTMSREAKDIASGKAPAQTKFNKPDLQLPGGKNYRELLLTLPEVGVSGNWEVVDRPGGMFAIQRPNGGLQTHSGDGSINEWSTRAGAEHSIAIYKKNDSQNGTSPPGFHSGHFNQPNVLAHVRFTERTDVDGARVLFLEEIQSDWHQDGRKKGYGGKEWQVQKDFGVEGWKFIGSFPSQQAAQTWVDENRAGNTLRVSQEAGAIPEAPFKATDEWAMLAFKRMARYAAENGFDKIGWTTGEQQIARYDLSKQIDSLRVRKESDQEFTVIAELKGGKLHEFGQLAPSELAQNVGKDLAEKITNQSDSYHEYRGLDLQVGGEGMVAFYDEILPAAINKWGKKLGARASTTKIDGAVEADTVVRGNVEHLFAVEQSLSTPFAGPVVIRNRKTNEATAFDTRAEGQRFISDQLGNTKAGPTVVHSVTVTPQMRSAALQGMTLFQKAGRNDIGLYSAVEQAIYDMPLPAWKKDGGVAKGAEVWAKLSKTPGVKAEELKWMGMEDYLKSGHVESSRDTRNDKFTRDEVAAFARNNGVRVEVIVADQEGSGSGDTDASFDWDESVDDDSENYAGAAEDFVGDVESDEDVHFWNWDRWIRDNDEAVGAAFGLTEQQVTDISDRDDLETFISDNGGEFDYQKLFELARDDVEESATDAARDQYMDEPYRNYSDSETGINIYGNDDVGYRVTSSGGSPIRDEIYNFSDAEEYAREWAIEEGLFGSQDDDAEVSKIAKWGGHVTSGAHSNYREIKLTLPDVPGTFVKDSHFDDENIVAFLRVTDRDMVAIDDGNEAPQMPDDFAPQHAPDGSNITYKKLKAALVEIEAGVKPDWVMDILTDKDTPIEEVERLTRNTISNMQKYWDKQHVKDKPAMSTFFIEENQSDWHQTGRKEGYRDAEVLARLSADLGRATEKLDEARAALAGVFRAAGMEAFVPNVIQIDTMDPFTVIGIAIGNGMSTASLSAPEIVEAMKRYSDADAAWDVAISERRKQSANAVPDAPFKNEGWLSLSIKSALVGAVEHGSQAFAWADSQVLVNRWSESYRKLYENQYDTKMVSLVKKLTGIVPQHFTMDGLPYPDAEIEENVAKMREGLVLHEQALEKSIRALPGFPSEASETEQSAWVNASPEAGRFTEEINRLRDKRENMRQLDKPEGYWAIPLTEELKAKIERDAYSLFQKGKENQGQIQIGADRTMAITLFKTANRSTFFHESAHFFLEVMSDLASDPSADPKLVADFAAIRKFVGATGDGFTEDQHERWARSFELYLRTGKAPSVDLIPAFARFRSWLESLYKHIQNLLDAGAKELSPEITGVMDRMIATDEEIEIAKAQHSMEALLPRAEASNLGLTPAQWDTYQGMIESATEEARAEVTAALMKAEKRERDKAWKQEADSVREEIEGHLEESLPFRAWRILTGRTPAGAAAPAELEGLTLDRAALADTYSKADMKGLRSLNVYRVEGGVHPDIAANALGFDSGDALVRALLTVRKAQASVEALVDAEMKRRNPDPLDDGSLPDRVTKALYGSKRVALFEHELALLAKLAGQPAPNARRMRAIAEAVIARRTPRTLRPRDYLAAERKAAREALKAAATGDYAKALQYKREQAQQAALFSEASRVKDLSDRQIEALRKAALPRTRERVGKAGKEYVDALDALLEGHELRAVSGKEVRRRDALRQWVAERQEDNDETAVSDELLERVEREKIVNVADLTIAQLADLAEAVKNLLHLAKFKNDLLSNNDARTWDEARTDLLGRARQSLAEGKPLPLSDADRTRLQKLGELYGGLMDFMLQPETVAEWLDGGETGPWHDYLWNQAEKAQTMRADLRRRVSTPMQEIMESMPAAQRNALSKIVKIKSLNRSVSRGTILSVLLNLGNESNRAKVMAGGEMIDGVQRPFTDEQIAEMMGHMTAADAQVVQRIWDTTNLLWPDIVKQQELLTGITPEKVDATPITIITRDGPVTLHGGYYPAVYDPRASSAGVKQAQAQEDKLFGGSFTKAVTSKGHVESRTQYAAPMLLDFHAVLSRHLNDVITDLSHRRYVKQALRILSDGEIKGVIYQRLSGGAYHALLGSVRNAVVGSSGISEPASKVATKVIQGAMTNTAVAALGFKIGLTVANTVSAPVQGLARVKPRYLAAGFARYYAHPFEQTKIIHELSPMMLERSEGHDTSYEQALAGIRGQHGIRATIAEVSLACHRTIVPLVERFVWMGRYMQATADGSNMAEAIRLADKAIRQTQTKHAPKDLSAAERDPRFKIFNLFLGPLVVINNRIQEAGLRGKLHGAVTTPGEAIGVWIAMIAGGQILFELFSGRGPDDDDEDGLDWEDWAVWIARKALLFPAQTIPLLRNAANVLEGFGGHTGSARPDPVTDAMSAVAKFGQTAYKQGVDNWILGEDDVDMKKVVVDSTKAAGVAYGVPSSQALITGQYLWDVGTGEYTPDNPAEAAKYLLYRRPKDE